MSDALSPSPASSSFAEAAERPPATVAGSRWQRLDELFERLGEYVNPILVKETRQALKSRQFTITFSVVLALGWMCTIFITAFLGPMVHVRPSGTDVFIWFYGILLLPMVLIVPFFAFRSLIAENEDNTYDLLSITTLSPRQIISGKLGSSLIQIVVYMSALAPCLAFTYLLRGIDVLMIGVILLYTFCGSLGLCVLCLFLATVTRDKFGQLILSVVVILGLAFVFFMSIALIGNLLFSSGGRELNDEWFWIGTAAMLTFYLANFALVYLAAAARLTFPSENRSTALRVAMVVEYLCIVAWMSFVWIDGGGDREFLCGFLAFAAAFWYAMGVLMTGELPIFSRRVMRGLPQSFLGRILFTWFNPGPGTGYGFAVVSFLSAVVLVAMALLLGELGAIFSGGNTPPGAVLAGGFVLVCYLTIFLGVGKLVVAWLSRIFGTNTAVPILIHGMMLFFAMIIPAALDWTMFGTSDFSLLHVTNPFWTTGEIMAGSSMPVETPTILILLTVVASAILLANWWSLKREMSYIRTSRPQRLVEDDAEMAPPIEPERTNPWDEG